jgi:hypothetical protein
MYPRLRLSNIQFIRIILSPFDLMGNKYSLVSEVISKPVSRLFYIFIDNGSAGQAVGRKGQPQIVKLRPSSIAHKYN